MAGQGFYPMNGRTLKVTDTVTGVASGATADIPVSQLLALAAGGGAGPTALRPNASVIGLMYFDTTLQQPIWSLSIGPTVWVNASGAVV